ncbi:hypothetical protein [Oceanobacillus damuensis]|uniref:hypothetical protein n=1 Tax=Oceanobacillus damuensis TaxID=937928 RepID=UPI00082D5BD0|nr:hypothetical protein [Oceanobacillus damuensis]
MFPERPRRPFHHDYGQREHGRFNALQQQVGKIDIDQVFATVNQIEKIYMELRPYVKKMINK